MTTATGYYATIAVPLSKDGAGNYARMEHISKHATRKEALAEARRVAATRPGCSGTVFGAQHVEA
jgi:hypothetical protein